jgi:hypothetical protein
MAYEEMSSLNDSETRIELIQMLIPVGLQAIEEELQSRVSKLAGARYTRTHPDLKRWGFLQRGISIFRRSKVANSSSSVKNRTWIPPPQRTQRGYKELAFLKKLLLIVG